MFRKHDNASVEGLLTVSSAVPGGPGASFLEPGDILLRINGSAITVFAELEGALDSNVGKVMSFEVMRGGELIKKDVEVQDLHEITPKSYVDPQVRRKSITQSHADPTLYITRMLGAQYGRLA